MMQVEILGVLQSRKLQHDYPVKKGRKTGRKEGPLTFDSNESNKYQITTDLNELQVVLTNYRGT